MAKAKKAKKLSPEELQEKNLIEALGKLLGASHFEVNQDCFAEEAEDLVGEGVTEAMYMAGSAEHIRPMIDEDIAVKIADAACDEYERLVREKYKRLKPSDFCW